MRALVNPASIVAIAWSVFQIFMVYGTPLHLMVAVPIHVMFALCLTFLLMPFSRATGGASISRSLDYALVVTALAIAAYFVLNAERVTTRIATVDPLPAADFVVGVATILLVIEATRRALGAGLTIVILVFLIYQFSGTFLREVPLLDTIAHRGEPSLRFFESLLDLQILQNAGVFGVPSVVSYTQVFYFLLFGAFLELYGGGRLFIDLGLLLVGRFRGGMAKVAVVSSTLFGAVSGSATANASVMGTFTIPAMKSAGMTAEEAAAIEATSSSGGQLMPPVMGAAAFLIAQFLGVPYADIALAGFIPALLFYAAIFFVVDATARRKGYRGVRKEELGVTWKGAAARLYLFAPVVLLVYQIMAGRALSSAIMEAIIAMTALGFAARTLSMRTELGLFKSAARAAKEVLRDSIAALDSGARAALSVAIPCAGAGIVVGVASMTNLGLTFGGFIELLSAGMLIPALLLIMVMVIIMGMGMPTTAAYIMGAILAIPALDQLGIPALASHFFVLYFAALSMVTPPVALATFVTGGIAKADIWKTGWLAFRFSLAGFLIPYALIMSPALLLQGTWPSTISATVTALIGCYALASCVTGWLRVETDFLDTALLFAAAVLLIAPLPVASTIGLILLGLVWLKQSRGRKTLGALPITSQARNVEK